MDLVLAKTVNRILTPRRESCFRSDMESSCYPISNIYGRLRPFRRDNQSKTERYRASGTCSDSSQQVDFGRIRYAIGAALDAQKPSSPYIGGQKMRPRAMVRWANARARRLLR